MRYKIRFFKISVVLLLGFMFLFSALVFSEDKANVADFTIEKKNPSISQVLYSDEALTVSKNFTMVEIAEKNGTEENINDLDINLGSSRWNMTKIEFNISDMYFQNETKTIEDNPKSARQLNKFSRGYAVQINITATTRIYGVKIWAVEISSEANPVYLQIRGYDPGTQKPNNVIHRSVLINVSSTPNWRIHTFADPVELSKGNYTLVLNGTALGANGKYDWSYNYGADVIYPDLYSWDYVGGGVWDTGSTGTPFLYKLDQQVLGNVYPSEIDMKVEIDEKDYPIQNGSAIGTGNFSMSFPDFFTDTSDLNLPITNNVSEALFFNITYKITLDHFLNFIGTVFIKDNQDNIWTVEPTFNRYENNYSIFYDYPDNWRDVSVFDGIENITKSPYIVDDGDILHIYNNTINETIQWKITANSDELPIVLTVFVTDYDAGDDLGFSVSAPAKLGNYTYILIDSRIFKMHEETLNITSTSKFDLNYTLLSNAISGTWIAYVFWTNSSDAGVQTQEFQIAGTTPGLTTVPGGDSDGGSKTKTKTDYFIIIVVAIVAGVITAGGFTSYYVFKGVQKNREHQRKRLYNKFTDILSLNHVIITDKKSGLNVFEEFFGGKLMDATLVSGFLDAIRSFGLELTGSHEHTQTIALEYQNYKVLMSEFKNFRLILIMTEKPSEDFLISIDKLSHDIGVKFGKQIESFRGGLTEFRGINDLIDKHLNTAFIAPLKVVSQIDMKLKPAERSMINKAKDIMKQNKLKYFYSTFLMPEQTFNPKDTELIFKLIDKKIFQPTSVS